MKRICYVLSILLSLITPALAGVSVSSPVSGSTVSSPVQYVATGTTSTCSTGVASMGVYVDNTLTYTVSGSSLNTAITMTPGGHNTVVEEWDRCGGATYTPVSVLVSGGTTGVTVTSPTPAVP